MMEKKRKRRKRSSSNTLTDVVAVAAMGDLTRLMELLEQGADPNVVGESGNTAVEEALINGDIEMVEVLVQYGAVVD